MISKICGIFVFKSIFIIQKIQIQKFKERTNNQCFSKTIAVRGVVEAF